MYMREKGIWKNAKMQDSEDVLTALRLLDIQEENLRPMNRFYRWVSRLFATYSIHVCNIVNCVPPPLVATE